LIDLAQWLSPLDGENPSGEDLRSTTQFEEILHMVEPREKENPDGPKKGAPQYVVEADWAIVLEKAEALRPVGRDLRLLVLVTRALANEMGLAGLTTGLTLIAQSIEAHWETMHPSLRRNAPPREAALRRINALVDLQNSQAGGLLQELRSKVIFAPRLVGPIKGEDLETAAMDEHTALMRTPGLGAKEMAAKSEEHKQLLARIKAACAAQAEQAPDAFNALRGDAKAALAALASVDAAANPKTDSHGAVAPELQRFLERVVVTLNRAPNAQGAEAAAEGSSEAGGTEAAPMQLNGHAAGSAAGGSYGLPDRISTREEVVKCLDLVIAFYDRTEPSSPIPHLTQRVRRMVHMDFLQLMEEMAPSGLKEFRLLAGVPENTKKAT
jgi:type VI secretion system protein ImpA